MSQEAVLFDLGLVAYEKAYTLQKRLVELVSKQKFPQTLLLLEHPPVYTVGKSGSRKVFLKDLKVLEVDRGGDITYHGPGQLVGYPILHLKGRRVSQYMRKLEESLILLLKEYSVKGTIKEGYPGIWVGEEKIASIGVRIREGVTYHGFALNVTVDLGAFQVIKPCGLDIAMTSLAKLMKKVSMEKVKRDYARSFEKCFDLTLTQRTTDLLERMCNGIL